MRCVLVSFFVLLNSAVLYDLVPNTEDRLSCAVAHIRDHDSLINANSKVSPKPPQTCRHARFIIAFLTFTTALQCNRWSEVCDVDIS